MPQAPIIAAIIQTTTPNVIKDGNDQLEQLVSAAANAGANFIATPEGSNLLEMDKAKFAIECPFDDDAAQLGFYQNLAKKLQINLLIGSALFQRRGQKAVNRSLLFAPTGDLIAKYDKIHLFDVNLGNGQEYLESNQYQRGNQAIIADIEIAKIGLSICYDIRFPHLYRALSQNGAQILSVPAAFTVPTGTAHWEVLLRARAIENGAFIIAPAQVGSHKDGRKTFGNSMIINPWGKIIARIDNDEIGFALAQINLEEVEIARNKIPAWGLNIEFNNP